MEKDDEYNLERDNLNYGHNRADYLIRKYGSIENIPPSIHKKKSPIEKTIEILENSNPDLVNFRNGIEFERILKRIAKTGYEIKNQYGFTIKDFSLIDGPRKREIYLSLKRQLIPNQK